ncbi:hypothetical protein M407DRAFT_7207 [Tulasnella calospora MUT 4182]|uniref:Uncharacterized protein n=1 Tax=Tulasnella calospora MUT 4182 TaxID=1051891 RepID=A0A0C3QK34_9AGAM|nr:hypothetical protein M407DRAFT_7207 [Tulasnella calospora MUT 4182]
MAPKYDEITDSGRESPAFSLNGKRTFHDPIEHSTHNKICPELVKNPYRMNLPKRDVVRILVFANRICDNLNRSVSKQEEEFLRPAGFTGQRRYKDYYRVHGHSIIIIDMYAKRGIEIQVEAPRTAEEVVTTIRQRQYLDVCRGTLNGSKTLPRILLKVEKILEEPTNMLVLPFQWTKQFKARKTVNPDYIAVKDRREYAGRAGDHRPLYGSGFPGFSAIGIWPITFGGVRAYTTRSGLVFM